MTSFGMRRSPLSSKPPKEYVPKTRSPAAPAPTIPSKPASIRDASSVPNPPPTKPPGNTTPELKPTKGGSGSMLGTVGAVAGVSLIPTFLNGAMPTNRGSGGGGGGSGGLLGDLLNTGSQLGTAAIAAEAFKSAVDSVTKLLGNPVNLAIAAAAVGGVIILSRR